jgi:ATP-binding cassette subfamily B protein
MTKTKETTDFRVIIRTAIRSLRYAFYYYPGMIVTLMVIQIAQALLGYVGIGALGGIIDELATITRTGESPDKVYSYMLIYIGSVVVPIIIGKVFDLVDAIFFRKFSDQISRRFDQIVATRDIQIIEDSEFQNKREKAREQGAWNIYRLAENSGLLLAKLISVIVGIGYLSLLSWRYAVLGVIAAIPSLVIEYIHGQRIYGAWDDDTDARRMYQEQKGQLHTKKDLIEIRLFTNTRHFLELIWVYVLNFQNIMLSKERIRLRDEFVGMTITIAAAAGVLYLIIDQVLFGIITVGALTVAMSSYSKIEFDMGRIFYLFSQLAKSSRYAKEYFAVMDTQNVLKLPENPQGLDYTKPIRIDFEHVSFRYPDNENWVFQDLNLTICAGSRVALVGHNGAGKTTFVNLLLRIYDPTEGRVLINGIDIREIDLEEYYEHTAALMQEFANYKFSAREVIALGNTRIPVDDERVRRAAHSSHAYSFIEKWEKGYDEIIGREFGGKELSGGEKQRMAIARVFYRDAGLIILDEPTSAVDAIAEQEIFESVYSNGNEKTILTISHRFSTVKKSDIILVVEHGKLVEQGSHAELLAKNGLYHQLYTAQASAYQD